MTSEKRIFGYLELEAEPSRVKSVLSDIRNVGRLAPGVQKIVRLDAPGNSALILVNMKIGAISFEREVEVKVASNEEGVSITSTTYGLKFEVDVKIAKSGTGSKVEYAVCGTPTSLAGRIVLDALGEKVIQEFANEFKQRAKRVLVED